MKAHIFIILATVCLIFVTCKHHSNSEHHEFARGADISWLTEQENDGVVFYNDNGESEDCIALLRSFGMNSVRLRVWVNHNTGWCNKADVIAKAKRANALEQRIMIDFHYSDNFADPQTQATPLAWQDYDLEQLKTAVVEHTTDILLALKNEGIEPEWVQIGNETTHGMLWPTGRIDKDGYEIEGGWQRYAALTTVGYYAAKQIFPNTIVIVHHDNAYEDNIHFFRQLISYGGRFDMIGLSHYPMMFIWSGKPWEEMNQLAENNIKALIEEFHCKVIIAEVGTQAYQEELSTIVMQDFMNRIQLIDSCAGIFYWEPQVFDGWKPQEYDTLGWGPYEMGSFTNDGRPAQSLRIMLKKQ